MEYCFRFVMKSFIHFIHSFIHSFETNLVIVFKMEFPSSNYPFNLQAWIGSCYGEVIAGYFQGWTPRELLGASEATLKEIAGQSVGGRMFGALNTIKAQGSCLPIILSYYGFPNFVFFPSQSATASRYTHHHHHLISIYLFNVLCR